MPDPRIFPIEEADDTFALVMPISAIIVVANPHRADLKIVNDTAYVEGETGDVYLARGNAAVVGSGIKLTRNGSFNMDTQDLFLGYIAAICNADEDCNVTISEGEWQ